MSTQYQNLSDYDSELMPDKEIVGSQKYAIVVADWNPDITNSLLNGAVTTLMANGVLKRNIVIHHVPGTFEITFAANQLMNQFEGVGEERKHTYAAILAIGCVIQGETPHFTFICNSVANGITQMNMSADGCPVIFGILTTNTLQQAKDRAGGIHGNKGDEAAVAAIKMANIVW
jgi:6,7-dimethyl-8-ribityllumazine synthase